MINELYTIHIITFIVSLSRIGLNKICLGNYLQRPIVFLHIRHKCGQNQSAILLYPLFNHGSFQVLQRQLSAVQSDVVNVVPLPQDLNSTFKVNLIFVESTRLASVGNTSLHTHYTFPSALRIVDISFQIIEEVYERHFTCHVGRVVVQGSLKKKGLLCVILALFVKLYRELTYHFEELVNGCESFFCLYAVFELVLFSFLVPYLEFFIVFPQEVSANLMV